MDQPLGRAVGNAVEVEEAIDVLRSQAPEDLTELCIELAAQMLLASGVQSSMPDARNRIRDTVRNGDGLEKFRKVIEAQGGDPRVIEDPNRLPRAREEFVIETEDVGFVSAIETRSIGRAAMLLGAGRERTTDSVDPAAGIMVEAKLGAKLERGAPIARLLYNDSKGLEEAAALVRSSYRISDEPPAESAPLIHALLSSERTG
jgi:thymidine phosphorylase